MRSTNFSRLTSRAATLWALAIPIFLSQSLSMSWALIDTAMLASFATEDLAALAIAGSFYMVLNVAGKGFLQALAPIVAHLVGQGQDREVGVMTRQAVWVAIVLAIVGALVLLSPGYLDWATLSPAVHEKARLYLRVIATGSLAVFLLRIVSALLQGVGRPAWYTGLLLVGLAVKFTLTYGLVFGKWGLPSLGVVGCATATATTNWLLFGLALLMAWRLRVWQRFELVRWSWPDLRHQWTLWRLGFPFGLGYWIEVSVFSAIAVAMSALGTEALAASAIVGNFLNWLFNVPLAISLAVAAQMGQLLGAGERQASYRAGQYALKAAGLLALILAGAVWLMPQVVVWIYHPKPELLPILYSVLGLVVLYHVGDAMQSVASFLNRAHKNAWFPALAYAVCMWGVALPAGYVLAFGWRGIPAWIPGLKGFYVGQTLGLFCVGLAMWAFWRWVLVVRHK